jgi:hypothetical protein
MEDSHSDFETAVNQNFVTKQQIKHVVSWNLFVFLTEFQWVKRFYETISDIVTLLPSNPEKLINKL